jgi:hypothetical protein
MSKDVKPELACDLCGDTGPLRVGSRCHPTAPLRAVLDGHQLTLRCYIPTCDRLVATFLLAHGGASTSGADS